MIIHLTARATSLPVALTDHEVATWLWPRLRRAFPNALAAILMPSHPHLVTPSDDPAASWRRLTHVLAGLRRSHGPGAAIRWEVPGPADVLGDAGKVGRMSRYLALNPCRAGLVRDPLSWPWSTYRDVVGAISHPWVDVARLAHGIRRRAAGFVDAYHSYVSSDPSVRVTGTPPPRPATPTDRAAQPLEALVAAAAAATRAAPAGIRRRGATRAAFVQLAARHGWHDTGRLASMCRVSPRAVQLLRHRGEPAAVAAAELCLGDPRLRHWQVPT